jgi:paraquat-inducible protein B
MSKKSNPTLIGSFVIGAVILIAVAVMLFGGAELFAPKTQLVSYFPGSVKGLRQGSNVLFRGVRVGYVNDIQLQGDVDTLETQVQVVMEVFPDLFVLTRQGLVVGEAAKGELGPQDLINAGLRAQLNVESFVTGQLLVEFDFHPSTPPLYRSENPPYVEVPTIPSDVERALQNVQMFIAEVQESLDVEKLVTDLQSAMAGIDELANSEDIRESLAGVNRLINDDDTQELTSSLSATLADARSALKDARRLINNADEKVGPLVDDLKPVIARLDRTLEAGEDALKSASVQIKGDTEFSYDLTSTLTEVQRAARSLRNFLDYLERNPEALVRGKR